MENTFATKAQTFNESMEILDGFDGCLEATQEYFKEWIGNVGGFDEWLAGGFLELRDMGLWAADVPHVQTQFGNYTFNPNSQKWLDDDELEDLTVEQSQLAL